MMKKIFLFAAMTALLAGAVVSCTDYPDEFGFEVNCTNFNYTPTSVTADGYDADLRATVEVLNEGEGISEYGFELDDKYLPATVQRNGNNVTVTATARGLNFGTIYGVDVVVKGKNAVARFGNSFSISKSQMAPKLRYNYLSMTDSHQLRVVTFFSLSNDAFQPEVVMSLGGVSQTAVINCDSAVAVFDLNQIDLESAAYISVKASNNFGEDKMDINFTAFKNANRARSIYFANASVDLENGLVELRGWCAYNGKPTVEPQVTFRFLNQTQTGAKYSEEFDNNYYYAYYRAQFSLNDLAVGSYSGSYMSYNSVFASLSDTHSADAVTVTTCWSNANDGDKGDYYQLNGVQWAKYDMYYNTYTGQVSLRADDTDYFPFGWTGDTYTGGLFTFWKVSVNPFSEYTSSGEFNVQGTARDIVYTNMSGWKLPSRSDFERLYGSNVSSVAWVGSDGYVTDIYFAPAKNNRRLVLRGQFSVESTSKMLRFHSLGVRRFYKSGNSWTATTEDYKNNITYMTSEFRNVYGGNSIIYAAQLYGNNVSFLELSFLHNLHVRPIKAY